MTPVSMLLETFSCLLAISTCRASEAKPAEMESHALSPFGIGSCYTNNRSAADNARWVPRIAEIGVHPYRTAHTDWSAIEPAEGTWNWTTLDEQMNYLEKQGFSPGAILAGNPQWNSMDARGSLPVRNLAGWSKYVAALATHLKGRVSLLEVWNEPPNGTGKDQTAADYAKIVSTAYDAAKAVDANYMIGLAAKSVDVNYLEQAIDAGAKDHFDYIVLHPYESLGNAVDHPGAEPMFMSIVPTVRKMLRSRDLAKADIPIIFTELGCDTRRGAAHQAHALVKAYTMGIAQGVGCIEWFEGRDGDSGPMGLLDGKGQPRPAFTAMAQMIRQLGQHPVYLGWMALNDHDQGFLFQGAENLVMVAWAPVGSQDEVSLGAAVRTLDPLTGQIASVEKLKLTEAPMFVLDPPAAVVSAAKASKGKPFSWAGDYADAKSVSVEFGTDNIEKGLHTQSGERIAQDVITYGGSARSGSVPGGSVFMVDPNFLSYTPTPIEISIVVRRNKANDNAGFKLNYESTHGFKNFGWYTVPDNKLWHTVRWKIDDAEFVGMYGFNFSLESDGNVYNKYDIQSVTVTKLGPALGGGPAK